MKVKVSRRQFLKILGLGTAVAAVSPQVVLDEVVKKSYNFEPGQLYRHAVLVRKPVRKWTEEEKLDLISTLDKWLKNKIHPDYLDLNRIQYVFDNDDWEETGAVGISYRVPKKPISKMNKKDEIEYGKDLEDYKGLGFEEVWRGKKEKHLRSMDL